MLVSLLQKMIGKRKRKKKKLMTLAKQIYCTISKYQADKNYFKYVHQCPISRKEIQGDNRKDNKKAENRTKGKNPLSF